MSGQRRPRPGASNEPSREALQAALAERTRELAETLQQQTATANVLKVISRAPFDLQAVFDALLSSAATLCGAMAGNLWVRDADILRHKASFGINPVLRTFLAEHPQHPSREMMAGRVLLSGKVEAIPDALEDKEYRAPAHGLTEARSILGVPLLRGPSVEGAIVLLKREPGPFPPRQIDLVQTFADQALIAIENARLFDEVHARTRDLEESLQQQTATADVLKVISRSAFDLQAVLDALLASAVRLTGVRGGAITLREGEALRVRAEAGRDPEYTREIMGRLITASRGSVSGRVLLSGEVEQIPDVRVDPDFDLPQTGSLARLGVPMLRNGKVEGVIVLVRDEPGRFTRRQIELVRTFADQAVIAIENVRLFDEVQTKTRDLEEALQQQTATADVLKVISRSAFDLQAVLDTLISSAVELSGAFSGAICVRDGDVFRYRGGAGPGYSEALQHYLESLQITPGRGTIAARALLSGQVEEIADVRDDVEYTLPLASYGNVSRALLGVPLLGKDRVEGTLTLTLREPGRFTRRQIELVQTFADQAVIAIENAGLFHEVQARTRDLEEALQRETATSEILRVIAGSPSDTKPVFDSICFTAVRSLRCDGAFVLMRDRDVYIHSAGATPQGPMTDLAPDRVPIDPSANFPSRAILAKETLYLPDWSQIDLPEHERNIHAMFGVCSALYLPLLREGECIGVIAVVGSRANAFGLKEIAQAESFRDQAVIAIQNARLFDEVQARTKDLQESLQQQTATADVLKVISRSAFDLQSVLHTLVESAAKLCDADRAVITREVSGVLYRAESYGFSDEFMAEIRRLPIVPERGTVSGRVLLEGKAIQIHDIEADPEYALKAYAKMEEFRTCLGIPMLRDGAPIGVISLLRTEVRPFNDKQIELVQTFADQAVIAIENARLFEEVQAKTRDLEEALQQQTATANVLKVISRSAFDLNVVLKTLTDSARSLSGAATATVLLRDGEVLRLCAESGCAPEFHEYMVVHPPRLGTKTGTGRVLMTGETVHIPDVMADPDYDYGPGPQLGNYRAQLGVPLIRDGKVEGVFGLLRPEPGAFTPRQIGLVRTFADQAVIAIENVRLFDEVQAKTRDLEEALAQQTATADVLKVISRSAFDLQSVLHTLVESAARLCDADKGTITREIDGVFYRAESYGFSEGFLAQVRDIPVVPERGTMSGRALLEGKAIQVEDVQADPEYTFKELSKTGDFRTCLGVPMLRNGAPIGVLVLLRTEVRPFNEKQIELVQTFADQAVIAIENARLFDEVQAKTRDLEEALQQQTATADVLKVISRSAFDLDAVLKTLTDSARSLSGAATAVVFLRDGEFARLRAESGCAPEFLKHLDAHPIRPGSETTTGRVMTTGEAVHIPDVLADPNYSYGAGPQVGDYRAVFGVPLLRGRQVDGVFTLMRPDPGAFTPRQKELVQAFADQAVIAIENARLFNEVQARTRDLSEALQQQTATANVLKVISRSAFDLQAVLTTLAESARELCDASFVTLSMRDGDAMRLRAESGCTPEIVEFMHAHPIRAGRETFTGRVMLSGEAVHLPDVLADPEYDFGEGPRIGNYRALLGVPLLREGRVEGVLGPFEVRQVLGVFALARPEPVPFTERQVEMVRAFADQAVIAIENARLFDEVQARTRELTASLDDLRKAQDRLIQSEKLASLGQLTAGIAHEIKNPLNFVNNFSGLSRELLEELRELLAKAPLDARMREEADELMATVGSNLDKVAQHGRRADSIVKNMLLHSRAGSGERASVNVNAMVEEALNLAYHGARAEKPGFNVAIAKSLDPNAGAAELFPQEMTRVLLNLISNGFYATTKRKQGEANPGYEPTLAASTRDLRDRVEIVIRDNGTGIPEEVKAKMFNPFFTTKPAGEGTGLGLSLSHDIVVKQHGGTIGVESEPGAYTQFTIQLPRAGQGAPAKPGAHN